MKNIFIFFLLLATPFESYADPCDPCDEVWATSVNLQALDSWQLAEKGDVSAQLQYGLWLFRLPKEYQNRTEGMKWIRKSAENGNLMARIGLAKFLSSDDVDKDLVNYMEAYAWYAVLNDEISMKKISLKLKPDELEQAKKLSKEYIDKYRNNKWLYF